MNEVALLTRRQVVEIIDVSPRTFVSMLKDGRFPRPVRISPKVHRWPESVVRAWLAQKMQEACAS